MRSPKSKEGCRVTLRQQKWLKEIAIYRKCGLKTYRMLKRLVLLSTKPPNYYGNGK